MKDTQISVQTAILEMDNSLPLPSFSSFITPTFRGSTIAFNSLAELRAVPEMADDQWTYGIRGTPTSYALASRLALIEGAKYASLYPSGLSAIVHIYLAFLKSGDEVLLPYNIYAPSHHFAQWLSQKFNIRVQRYNPMDINQIEKLIDQKTRLIWLEAPGSVSMEVPQVDKIVALAKKHQLLTALDNTYSAGLTFKPFEHDLDISVQALSKYQSGCSDVLAGAVMTNNQDLHVAIKKVRNYLGTHLSSDDCSLILRGLPSMSLRYSHHGKQALTLAQWFKNRSEIKKVLHPAFADCPGHEYFQANFSASGGLFSVIFSERYSVKQVENFIDALKLFSIGWSWGGAHSMVMPYDMKHHPKWQEKGTLVRFFVGLEDIQDLLKDIEQAIVHAL